MSMEFARYWQDMPMITSYSESIYLHESRFTQHFADRGFTFAVTFDPDDYPAPSTHFRERPADAGRPLPDHQTSAVLPRVQLPGAQGHPRPAADGEGGHRDRLPGRPHLARRGALRRAAHPLHQLHAARHRAGLRPAAGGHADAADLRPGAHLLRRHDRRDDGDDREHPGPLRHRRHHHRRHQEGRHRGRAGPLRAAPRRGPDREVQPRPRRERIPHHLPGRPHLR